MTPRPDIPVQTLRQLLRLEATNAQNCANRCPQIATASKFKGVTPHIRGGKWRAQVEKDGRAHYLGLFDSETEAARAYDVAAIALFGDFARTNQSIGLL